MAGGEEGDVNGQVEAARGAPEMWNAVPDLPGRDAPGARCGRANGIDG